MSPVVKKKGEKFTLPSKYLLFILTILCTVMMLITFGTDVFNRPLNTAVGYVIIPFQRGIGKAGEWLSNRSEELGQIRELLEEISMSSINFGSFSLWTSSTKSITRWGPGSSAGIPGTGTPHLLLTKGKRTGLRWI